MTLEVELLNERIRPLLPASLLPRHNPPPKEVILFVELLELLQLRLVLRRTGRTGARPQAAPYWHRPVARSPAWSVRTRAAARGGEHSRSSGSRAPSSPPRHRKGGLLPKGHMHWHEKSACNEGGQSACNPREQSACNQGEQSACNQGEQSACNQGGQSACNRHERLTEK